MAQKGTKGKTSHKRSPGEKAQAEARTAKRKDRRVFISSHGAYKTVAEMVAAAKPKRSNIPQHVYQNQQSALAAS